MVLFITPDNFVLPSYKEQMTSDTGDDETHKDRPNQEGHVKNDVQPCINYSN